MEAAQNLSPTAHNVIFLELMLPPGVLLRKRTLGPLHEAAELLFGHALTHNSMSNSAQT